jgi:uncharacterized membrane protein YphA (DoxX/SURF4 family)
MRIELEDAPQAAWVSLTQASLRCVLGAILLRHGLEKLQHPSDHTAMLTSLHLPEAPLLTQAVFALELLAGACLIFGRFTRTAAFLAMFDVALHAAASFALGEMWPMPAKLEPIALMVAVCCFFLVVGSGPFGLDYVLKRRARLRAIARDDIWSRPPYVRSR